MAFTNYNELQLEVADWLNRTDLTARIPGFIALCEAQISRVVRARSVRSDITLDAEVVTPTAQSGPHPALASFGELRSLTLKGATSLTRRPIKIVTPETLADRRRIHIASGVPLYAVFVNGDLLLSPTPDQTYTGEVVFYEKLLPLATNGANDTLTNAPDVYLYGTLLEAATFLEHDDRIQQWQDRFDRAVADFNKARERAEYGASLRPVRLPVVF